MSLSAGASGVRSSRRGVWWIVVIVVVVGLGAGGYATWMLRGASPERAAETYVDALMTGDTEALAATGFTIPDAAARAFAAAVERPSEARVDRVRGEGDVRHATIVFTLDGEVREAVVTLRRHGWAGWAPGDDAWGSVLPESSLGEAITLGGSRWPVGASHALLPAVYAVAASPADFLTGSGEVTVLPGASVVASVNAAVDPSATPAVQNALDEYLAACTADAGEIPAHCGIRIPWATELATVGAVRFTVREFPAVEAIDGLQWRASNGVLEATLDGTSLDGNPATVTYSTEKWNVAGSVSFDGDDLVLHVR